MTIKVKILLENDEILNPNGTEYVFKYYFFYENFNSFRHTYKYKYKV